MKFSVLDGSNRALELDVPLDQQGVSDYSIIEVTELPRSQIASDHQTLSESSTHTSTIFDDVFSIFEDSKPEEDDQITLVCNFGQPVEYICSPSTKIMGVFKYFMNYRFDNAVTDEQLNEYCLVSSRDNNTPLSLRQTVRDCGLSDGDEVVRTDECRH